MSFAEFTTKYRNANNPATNKPWKPEEIISNSGLPEGVVKDYLGFWDAVQIITVKRYNRMPTNEEIIVQHDGPPPAPVVIPPVVVQPRDPATCIKTPWGLYKPAPLPDGSKKLGDMTWDEYEAGQIHILSEQFQK